MASGVMAGAGARFTSLKQGNGWAVVGKLIQSTLSKVYKLVGQFIDGIVVGLESSIFTLADKLLKGELPRRRRWSRRR